MPAEHFALPPHGQQQLHIRWDDAWKNLTIWLDDEVLDKLEDGAADLRREHRFSLPDGAQLSLALETRGAHDLRLTYNGRRLAPLLPADARRWQQATAVILTVGALDVVLALVLALTELPATRFAPLGIVWPFSALSGSLIFVAGLVLQRRRWLPALVAAIALYIVDALLGYSQVTALGGNAGILGVLARAWFAYYMVQGVPALRALAAQ